MNGDDPYSDDLGDSLDADLVDLDLGDLDLGDVEVDGPTPAPPHEFDRSWRPADHSWGEAEETSWDASHGRPSDDGLEPGRHRAG